MSELVVEVCKIDKIIPHKNADKLEICRVKGWDCIVGKCEYKAGDRVVFVPPDTTIPKETAERLGIINFLAGKAHNRVKTIQLRGEISYGLILPNEKNWKVGTNVAEFYGIEKYAPPVRLTMGDAGPEDSFFMKLTDVENINNYPDIFEEGEMVAVTEKIDGTFCRVGCSFWNVNMDDDDFNNRDMEVYEMSPFDKDEPKYCVWKAGSRNVIRKRPLEINEMTKNYYWYPYTLDAVYNLVEHLLYNCGACHVQLFGEVFGEGISGGSKSLNYGVNKGLAFRAFGLKINEEKVNYQMFKTLCDKFGVLTVPEVAVIPYNFEKIKELAKGDSILAAENGVEHIREGVVVCSYDKDGTKTKVPPIAKFLNPNYLLLKEKGKIEDFTDE